MRQIACTFTLLLIVAHPGSLFAQDDPAGIEFFEKHIRPVLVDHCYKCHSADSPKLRGNLLLDSKEGTRKGGKTGPAVVPGKVDDSLLIHALRYQKLEMPPNGKLPAKVIADFEKWVAMGAPDPRKGKSGTTKTKVIDYTEALKHWAYQPIKKPAPPLVKNAIWGDSPIDLYILAQLEAKGLTPSPKADKRTLIRRAYFDLIGLPPPYAEVEAFANDPDPKAFEKVVDKLLASPHYGERWGRHWLDVARYSDTKDLVLVYGKDAIRPYAYTYRDYVVKAFNLDLPYDQFIHDQLAGDLVQPKLEPWRLGAMGFLTLGRLFDNNLPDIYDDQIDTTTRGFLGLTVSCARCHDHKYDAIPTADYYSLYGVFASSEQPTELPLIEQPKQSPEAQDFFKKWSAKEQELKNHVETQFNQLNEQFRNQSTEYLVKIAAEPPDPLETAVFFLSLSPNDLRPQLLSNWRAYLKKHGHDDPVFGPWHDLLELDDKELGEKALSVIKHWSAVADGVENGKLNPLIKQALSSAKLSSKKDVAKLYGELLKQNYQQSKKNTKLSAAEQQLLDILVGPASPFFFHKSKTFEYMSRVPRTTYGSLLQQLDRLAVDQPHAPPRAMILVDSPIVYSPKIFTRGNPNTPGQSVPRQFLHILTGAKPTPFGDGSGRLKLAQAITAADNPLTSRVMANRIWLHHFGEPLVTTPDDFGTRSDPPSHPELLDYLAWSFRHEGWSIKKLHRQILLSSTYQQASLDRPECSKIDPENRLLWKYNRRHLDLEALRDSMLFVSGRLDTKFGGPPLDLVKDAKNGRRTLYGIVDRQDLPNLYRAFNFASPDQTAGTRPKTIVPQQALFAMNSAFILEQVKALAAQPELTKEMDRKKRIALLYHLVFQREPTAKEMALGIAFIQTAESAMAPPNPAHLNAWQQYAQVLLMTNEFAFLE